MSLLRPVSIFLRNFLIKQHPYFSCCASCGEIKIPLGTRLCTSLSPLFAVDAVIRLEGSETNPHAFAASLKEHLPWLNKIFLLNDSAADEPETNPGKNVIRIAPAPVPSPNREENPVALPESRLHSLAELQDYYLVFTAGICPSSPTDQLDWYTPNGLPLLASKRIYGIPAQIALEPNGEELLLEYLLQSRPSDVKYCMYAHNKKNSEDFEDFYRLYENQAKAADATVMPYGLALAHWLFATKRGVVVPSTFQS